MLIDEYKNHKINALKKLENFQNEFIKPLENYSEIQNVDFLNNKIIDTYNNIKSNEFIVALFGAFSDGKSTIIKVLTNDDNIEISPLPETDQINVYDLNKTVKIVDTPGMFSEFKNHTEKTKRYISNANLIFYVVSAENPLKDSQIDTIKWIMKDLRKKDSMIFLLNKMDSVTDLYDESEFEKMCDVKIENIRDTLKNIDIFVKEDNFICISADPYAEGLDYWLKENDYGKISRMDKLDKKLNKVLENNKEELIIKVANSILNDCKTIILNEVGSFNYSKGELISLEAKNLNYITNEIEILDKDIKNSFDNINANLESLRLEYLSKINNIKAPEDYANYFDSSLGKDSYILEERINNIFKFEIDNLVSEHTETMKKIELNSEKYQKQKSKVLGAGSTYGKQLAKGLTGIPNDQLVKGIKIVRDSTKLPIKFKPWGMTKLAKNLKYGGAALAVGIDAISTYFSVKSQEEFETNVNQHKEEVLDLFKNIKTNNTLENFLDNYFPNIRDLKQEQYEKAKLIEKNKKSFNDLNYYLEKLQLYK